MQNSDNPNINYPNVDSYMYPTLNEKKETTLNASAPPIPSYNSGTTQMNYPQNNYPQMGFKSEQQYKDSLNPFSESFNPNFVPQPYNYPSYQPQTINNQGSSQKNMPFNAQTNNQQNFYPQNNPQAFYPQNAQQFNHPQTNQQFNHPQTNQQFNHPQTNQQFNHPQTNPQFNYPQTNPQVNYSEISKSYLKEKKKTSSSSSHAHSKKKKSNSTQYHSINANASSSSMPQAKPTYVGMNQTGVMSTPKVSNSGDNPKNKYIAKTRRVFRVKEKWFSFKNDMLIYDENDNVVFKVKGKFFSFGANLKMENMFGTQVSKIKQQILTFMPTYNIYQEEKKVAVLKKTFQLFGFRDKFTFDIIDTPGIDFKVIGSYWDHNFKIKRGDQTVAEISKKFFTFRDSYGVRVEKGENIVLILSCCVALDKYLDEQERKKNS